MLSHITPLRLRSAFLISLLPALAILSVLLALNLVTLKAQEKPSEDPPPEAIKAIIEGKRLYDQGTAASARMAIAKIEEAVRLFHEAKDLRNEANSLGILAEFYNTLGESRKALQYLEQAVPLMHAAGNTNGEAVLMTIAGNIYNSLGDKVKALEYFNQALPLLRAAGLRDAEAATLRSIGSVYDDLGDFNKALENYQQSLEISKSLNDINNEGETLVNLGVVFLQLGELQKALDVYTQVLPLMKKIGNKNGEATALINLGILHKWLEEKQKALEFFNQALPLLKLVGNKNGEASVLANIGAIYNESNDNRKAIEFYEQALALAREIGDKKAESRTLVNLGIAYKGVGQHQKALDIYNQALSLTRLLGDKSGEAGTLSSLGAIAAASGDRQKALDFLNQSLAIRQAIGDISGQAILLYNIAHIERDRGNLNEAQRKVEAALELVESLRVKYTNQELRTNYFASVDDYYRFYIDLLMRRHKQQPSAGFDAAALQASERVRARALLELLAESKSDIRQGVEPRLLERERSLQRQLNAAAQQQLALLNQQFDAQAAARITRELEELTSAFQQVESQIRQSSPAYAALTQPRPLTLREIQTQVLDDDTLLLEYSLGSERSFLWVVTPSTVTSYELPGREEIETASRRVYDLLNARNQEVVGETPAQKLKRIERADAEYLQAATQLSRLILSPAAKAFVKKRLLIVSDGALQYIPFAALPDVTNELAPLIVKYEVVNSPSASIIALLRSAGRDKNPTSKTIAVLADPVFERDDPRIKLVGGRPPARGGGKQETAGKRELVHDPVKKAAQDTAIAGTGLRIPRLPGTRKEAERILALVAPAEGKGSFDFAANRATATDAELSRYRYVHFATHGFLNSQHPELSGVLLSLYNERGEPEDGFLRLHEVFNLKLEADMVVLSACQTGLGKEVKGEGLIGLTRGFMYAGTPRVVVSLWSVSDRATADLMERFYRGILVEHLTPAASLRAAQIGLWRQKQRSEPYYWAAFILQGEWH